MSDYSNFQPVNPMANFQQGYGLGQVIQQNVQAKAMAEAERQRKEQYGAAFNKAMDTRDPADYMELVNLTPPDQRENFIKAWDSMEAKDQQNTIKKLVSRGSAFASGNPEVVREDLQREYDAAEVEGDKQAMSALKMQISAIDNGQPEIAEMINNNMLAMTPQSQGYLDNIKTMRDTQKVEQDMVYQIFKEGQALKRSGAELNELVETAKNDPELGEEILKSLRYATAFNAGDDMSAFDRQKSFDGLRGEWDKASKDYQKASRSNDGVQNAYATAMANNGGDSGYVDANGEPVPEGTKGAVPVSGIADLTLINLFQRQIDEATVRESDITNIMSTVGGMGAIKLWFNKLMTGQKLEPGQRKQIAEMSEKLLEQQKKMVDTKIYPAIEKAASNYGANPDEKFSVFGGYEPTFDFEGKRIGEKIAEAPATLSESSSVAGATTPAPSWFYDYALSDEITMSKLTAEEKKALEDRTLTMADIKANWNGTWNRGQASFNTTSGDGTSVRQ